MNKKLIQLKGPFKANQELVDLIKDKDKDSDFKYIKEIGIQTDIRNYVELDRKIFEIGKTGILQFKDVHITSIKFTQDVNEKTIIDCVLA